MTLAFWISRLFEKFLPPSCGIAARSLSPCLSTRLFNISARQTTFPVTSGASTKTRGTTASSSDRATMISSPDSSHGFHRGWDVREDDGVLYLPIDMPGLTKEHVNVSVDENKLVVRGEGREYSSRIDLPPEVYHLDMVRAEMKNGVLKVVVPKVKAYERKDVVQIQVE
ncbi:unnamed protein product [Spirodela intermedia]|uniref:SHSP domain-containing protein n=1 Tax=Spirodela intermedia TaxID=51605 RepID=A0A7I8J6H6_SPIIN|nr:unnamed protein product [Spirodela intermedia]CAA6665003.1 unnamed protein product [Spirodela intermedia]